MTRRSMQPDETKNLNAESDNCTIDLEMLNEYASTRFRQTSGADDQVDILVNSLRNSGWSSR